MKIVSIHEAKAHLPRLIREAMQGEDIVIARDDEPLVRLVVIESVRAQRSVGWAKGQITVAADVDAPIGDLAGYQ